MPRSRFTLKRDRLRHRLGLGNHHQFAVRRHKTWYRQVGELVLTAIVGAVLLLSYQAVDRYFHPKEIELIQLREKVGELSAEISRLNSLEGTGQNAVLMAQTAQQALAQQLEKSQLDAAKLKEDLGFCEKSVKRDLGVRKAPIQIPGAGTIPAGSSPN